MGSRVLFVVIFALVTGCLGGSTGKLQFRVEEYRADPNYAALYPESYEAFKTTFYPLARTYCLNCHHSAWEGAPLAFFADPDPQVAFNSMTQKQKVNLADPAMSRIVRKPVDENHNCWSDCQDNSDEILGLVQDWASQVPEAYAPGDVLR